MLVCPHDMLQNHPIGIEGVTMQNKSCQDGGGLLRVAASSNQLDQPTPVAIVLGTDPSIGLCSVAKIPYGVDELSVAGALRGEAVPVVHAKTVDLMVPANAEIVIEGFIRKNELEWEGPFGEFTGYMGPHSESF